MCKKIFYRKDVAFTKEEKIFQAKCSPNLQI